MCGDAWRRLDDDFDRIIGGLKVEARTAAVGADRTTMRAVRRAAIESARVDRRSPEEAGPPAAMGNGKEGRPKPAQFASGGSQGIATTTREQVLPVVVTLEGVQLANRLTAEAQI